MTENQTEKRMARIRQRETGLKYTQALIQIRKEAEGRCRYFGGESLLPEKNKDCSRPAREWQYRLYLCEEHYCAMMWESEDVPAELRVPDRVRSDVDTTWLPYGRKMEPPYSLKAAQQMMKQAQIYMAFSERTYQ